MKRITATLEDDDVVKVVGTLVKLGVDFTVESVGTPEPDKKTMHREFTSLNDQIMDYLRDQPKSHAMYGNIENEFVAKGYKASSVRTAVNKIRTLGRVVTSGNMVALLGEKTG